MAVYLADLAGLAGGVVGSVRGRVGTHVDKFVVAVGWGADAQWGRDLLIGEAVADLFRGVFLDAG